ncbi:MAG: hypothetical protein ACFCVG_16655 [Kineosporiaceae bacterium]
MAGRQRPLLTHDAARDLTERLRDSPDGSPGLVLHAFITRAWALDFDDWSDFCRDVVPFQRHPADEHGGGPATASRRRIP